jgi:UV DNA damage endonuclease
MRIGYPCLNRGLGCTPSHSFRLASYAPARLEATVAANLDCLKRMVEFNARHGLLFLRITSDLVPFASHPVCRFDWKSRFAAEFASIGRAIRRHRLRISMHPDQFVLINAQDYRIVEASFAELEYQAALLDLFGLDLSARLQIHIGGLYGDRESSLNRFVANFLRLAPPVRRRLTIENDDRSYPLADCLRLHEKTGIPVLLDTLHHDILNHGESLGQALALAGRTWSPGQGVPLVDYSSQAQGEKRGRHAARLDSAHFRRFLIDSRPHDFDLMLEIKDKERSACRARRIAIKSNDPRLLPPAADGDRRLRRGCAASTQPGGAAGRPAAAGSRGRNGARSD